MKPALILALLFGSFNGAAFASGSKAVATAAAVSTLAVNLMDIKTTVHKWKRAARIAGRGMKKVVGK